MSKPLRVLLVEDNPNDSEMVLRELRQAGFDPDWLRVETEPDFLARLQPEPDIILSDFAMPEFSGPRALELLKQSGLDIPFIIISGTIGEDVAVEVMRQGATDYLLKDRTARLGLAVEQAMEQARLRRERKKAVESLRKNEQELRKLAAELEIERARLSAAQTVAKMGSWDTDLSSMAVIWSAETYRIFEVTPEQYQPTHQGFLEFVHPEDREEVDRAFVQSLDQRHVSSVEHRLLLASGRIKFVEEHWQVFHDEQDKPRRALGTCRDITERKLAETELRWKTAFLEAQVNSSLDGIIVVDAEGRKILQNQRTSDIFNIPRPFAENEDDRDQLNWVTNMTVNPAAFVQRVMELYARPEEVGRDEIELKDGTVLDRYTSPVVGADGHYYGRIWYFRDITERKRAEEALRETKRFLQSTFNALSSHISILDEHGIIIAVNAAWNRFAAENGFIGSLQGVGDNYLQICDSATGQHADEAGEVAMGIRGVMTGQQDEFQLEYPCHSPWEQRWFVVRVTRFSGDGPLRVVVAHENITERKRAEDALRESEWQLREQASLLDKARDAILVRDLEHGITYWNQGAQRLYGWTAAEVMGRKASELLYRDHRAFEPAIAAVHRDGEWRGEIEQINKAGDVILIEARWTLVRDDAGRPHSVLAINTDITEKKKLEQQFLRIQRMESIGTLAGGIAHDLNNVLAPILMSIELLRLTSRDERAKAMLTTIETSARRGADMVRQILTFARGVEGQRVMIHPRQIIEEMQHLVQDTFPKNILFHANLPASLPAFIGDHTQVHQVLLNLCVNARDAMPEGGTLTVSASAVHLDEQYAASNAQVKPGDHVRITVSDTGTGIPPEVIEKIFDPFFTTKELGKGTGLGLSTVLTIVKSHGGFLNVESAPGKGTTFSVYFPSGAAGADATTISPEEINPRGHSEMILVVDDEASVRTITQQTLEAFGYRVLVAADGAEAASLYMQHQAEISVVLTDMMMPVMDGAATIQVLQRINPAVKIIAASGLAGDGGSARVIGMGVNHFLPKPYTAHTLLITLRQALNEATHQKP